MPPNKESPFLKKLFAEFLGTFFLVFAGTGAIIVNEISGGSLSHVGVSLTFGLVILVMIYSLGETSGAHFNPAVSLGFCAARRMAIREGLAYMASQCIGALAASLTLHFLFPVSSTLGTTFPTGGVFPAWTLEFFMTALLMFVILSVSIGPKEKGITAGIAIGGTIALEALFGGPISGASMNPARSLAPALISGHLQGLWVYLTAPILGALLSVILCRCTQAQGCCVKAAEPPLA
jgi:aquaporin Z